MPIVIQRFGALDEKMDLLMFAKGEICGKFGALNLH